MRLDKFLSHTGFGSRKEVKELLKKKVVSVNGEAVTKGDLNVNPKEDEVRVFGEEVAYEQYTYLMMNKPPGVLSATEDNYQPTVIDLLELSVSSGNLFPVGRLDKDTEGLLLLTDDGELAHFLLSPRRHVAKKYFAVVSGIMDERDISHFREGIRLEDGYQCLPAELEIEAVNPVRQESHVHITIQEGKFHQVKRMVQACGKEVSFLKRLTMGPLSLDPTLEAGEYRPLAEEEVEALLQYIPIEILRKRDMV